MKTITRRGPTFCFFISFFLLILFLLKSQSAFALPAGFQEFYLPLPSGDNIATPPYNGTYSIFNAIEPPINASDGMHYVVGVTASSDNTTVYYDHWENGLGTGTSADEIYSLNKGEVRYFESSAIPVPRGTTTKYDGGDRIFVSGSLLQLVISTWTEDQGTVFSDAWEIYPRQAWEQDYTIPVGENLAASPTSYRDFTYVYALIMSASNGNAIEIRNAAGTLLASTTLNRGKTYIYKVANAATTVHGASPVQVQLMTGRRDTSGWEMRGYTMMPKSFWGTSYWAPVPSWSSGNSDLFIYNPNPSAITVQFQDLTGSGSFSLAAGQTRNYRTGAGRYVPRNSGVHLWSDSVFWGIASGDTGSATWDWGYSLIPENFLGTDNYVSWAPGTSNLTANGSPVYVSALFDNTKVFVDYGPNNGVFDTTFSLNKLQVFQIYDPDKNNTGMHIVSTKPVSIAWGESPDTAGSGNPYLDMGYTTLPLPVEWIDVAMEVSKTADLEFINIGEETTFTIIISVPPSAGSAVTGIDLVDTLPPGWAYVTGSGTPSDPDDISGDILTWNGNWTINPGESQTVTFQAEATATADTTNPNRDVAAATGTALGATLTAEDDAFVDVVEAGPAVLTAVKTWSLLEDVNGNSEVNPGDILRYVVIVGNTGQTAATTVALTDTPDPNTTLIAGTVTTCQCPGCTVTTGNTPGDTSVAVMIGTLEPGTTVQVCYQVRVSGLEGFTQVVNNGSVTADGPLSAPFTDTTPVVIPPPVLTITKTGPADIVVEAGTTNILIQYSGILTNTTETPAHNVLLVDQLPAGVEFVSSSHSAVYDGINKVTWNLGTLGPGVSIPGWLLVRTNTTFDDGDTLLNQFSLTWEDIGHTAYGPATATATTTVHTHPMLTLEKSGPTEALRGEQFSYELTLRNIGQAAAEHVSLTDTLPAGLTYVGSSPAGTFAGDTVTWADLGTLTAGSTQVVTVTVKVDTDVPNATLLTDAAAVSWEDSLENTYGPVPATAGTTVYTEPQLTITKSGPAEAEVGTIITYTGILSNVGGSEAFDVVLTDQLPSGVTFVSSSQDAVYNIEANTVTWNLGTLEAGASLPGWITVRINDGIPNGTVLTNEFAVTGEDALGNPLPEITATADTTVRSHPLLLVEKTGPADAYPNQVFSYTLKVTNVGASPAYHVALSDDMPKNDDLDTGFIYVGSNPAGTEEAGGIITWGDLGTIQPGGVVTLTVTVQVEASVPNGATLTNIASATWKNVTGQIFGPAAGTADTTIHTLPDLTITKEGPAEAEVGSTVTYTGTLTNVGGSTATDVVLVDQLPSGVTFVSSSHSGVYDGATHTVTWQIGTVGPGVSIPGWITLQIGETFQDGSILTDVFTANGKSPDPENIPLPDKTADTSTTVRTHPLLVIEKTGPAQTHPGENIVYTLKITNTGGTQASQVILQDFLPPGLTYVSANPAGTHDSGIVTWNLGTILPGTAVTVQVTVSVDASVANNTELLDTAGVTWQDSGGQDYGPARAAAKTKVFTRPELTISKTGPALSYPGATLTFTLGICNTGGTQATNIILKDFLPAGFTYVSSVPAGTHVGGVVTWNLDPLDPGACRTVSLTVTVAGGALNTTLTNIARVTWEDTGGGSYGPAGSETDTLISSEPQLAITKTGPSLAANGDDMTFTLHICNEGGNTAGAVVITDQTPQGFDYVSSNPAGTYDAGTGTVTWTFEAIDSGECVDISLILQAGCTLPPLATVINTAGAAWHGLEGSDFGPVFSSWETRLRKVLLLTKTASPGEVYPGQTITYTILCRNTGASSLKNAIVSETYDPGVVYVSAAPAPDPGTNHQWTFPEILPDGQKTITITVRVSDTAAQDTTLRNEAAFSAQINDGECIAEDTAFAENTVSERPPAVIPTLSPWGMAILILLITAVAIRSTQRSRAKKVAV